MSLAQQIIDDIKKKLSDSDFEKSVVEPAAKIFIESSRSQSKSGQDATGAPFERLVPKYAKKKYKEVGSVRADLHYGAAGARKNSPSRQRYNATKGAYDVIDYSTTNNSIDVHFGSYKTINNYMEDHQTGGQYTGRRGLPQRKWLAENESDMQSQPQRDNMEKVSELLSDYLKLPIEMSAKGTIKLKV